MKRMFVYIVTVFAIASITAFFVAFASGDDTKNIEFLENYRWEVETPYIEKEEVQIPEEFDDVYNNYNELQQQAGLDLAPYKGKKAVRYTYIVTNYPKQIDEPVRANVLCVDHEPIAGDIMTVSISGFMHSLRFEDAR